MRANETAREMARVWEQERERSEQDSIASADDKLRAVQGEMGQTGKILSPRQLGLLAKLKECRVPEMRESEGGVALHGQLQLRLFENILKQVNVMFIQFCMHVTVYVCISPSFPLPPTPPLHTLSSLTRARARSLFSLSLCLSLSLSLFLSLCPSLSLCL